MAYRFIAAKKTAALQSSEDTSLSSVPVRVLCRSLGVSSSGYYAWLERPASARAVADAALTATIHAIHTVSRGTYGAPRIHAELVDPGGAYGVRCGRKRVARLMREAGLQAKGKKRFKATSALTV